MFLLILEPTYGKYKVQNSFQNFHPSVHLQLLSLRTILYTLYILHF